MRRNPLIRPSLRIVLLAGAAFAPAVASAQETAVFDDAIVVTAQKREQNLQDIGLSVSALGGAALDSMGRQDVTALA